jgi:hypothetical protein
MGQSESQLKKKRLLSEKDYSNFLQTSKKIRNSIFKKKPKQAIQLFSLPRPIILTIFEYLSGEDLCRLSLTCSYVFQFLEENPRPWFTAFTKWIQAFLEKVLLQAELSSENTNPIFDSQEADMKDINTNDTPTEAQKNKSLGTPIRAPKDIRPIESWNGVIKSLVDYIAPVAWSVPYGYLSQWGITWLNNSPPWATCTVSARVIPLPMSYFGLACRMEQPFDIIQILSKTTWAFRSGLILPEQREMEEGLLSFGDFFGVSIAISENYKLVKNKQELSEILSCDSLKGSPTSDQLLNKLSILLKSSEMMIWSGDYPKILSVGKNRVVVIHWQFDVTSVRSCHACGMG